MLKIGQYEYQEVTGAESAGLVEKCQENGWLREGGYAWQDDPFLEEYPYSFVRTDSIDGLRDYFGGNWALRQGILYDDLAFIQQVDGGDEWWTLKKLPDGKWLDFESWSFNNARKDPVQFSRAIVSMQMATAEECSRLEYMLPRDGKNAWSFERRLETSSDGRETYIRIFSSETAGGYRGSVREAPNGCGWRMSVERPDGTEAEPLSGLESAVEAASEAERHLRSWPHEVGRHESLGELAKTATRASEASFGSGASRSQEKVR